MNDRQERRRRRFASRSTPSLDYLVFDNAPRRPLNTPTTGLDDRLEALADLNTFTNTIDALVARTELRTINTT